MIDEEQKNYLNKIRDLLQRLNLECLAYLQRFIAEASYTKSQSGNTGVEK